jgi:hypothetical protein
MATKNPQQSAQSLKQEREERRLAKVAAFKQQRARAARTRRIAIGSSIVGGVAVVALAVWAVGSSITPATDPASITIEGLTTFPDLTGGGHVDYTADGQYIENPPTVDYLAQYGMNPPAGGEHWGAWLNCGIYTEPQQNERAVHALEHGAVWVTYDPAALSTAEIATLQQSVPSTFMVVSPYPGLPAPVVASAWGAQVALDGVDDSRLGEFITKYWKSPNAPEVGASCTGAVDGPGRVG